MKKALKKSTCAIWHFVDGVKVDGPHDKIEGNVSGIYGNVSGIEGDVSGIEGDVSRIEGNLDACEITDDDRMNDINIKDLIQ